MYTLNGKYPMLGVSEQYLKKGDVIVFHYTDDYTLEAADMGPAPEEKKTADEVIALINAIGVVDLTKGDVIAKARAAYDALSAADKELVTNYQTLLDAEAAYAKLVAELGIGFTPVAAQSLPVHEAAPSAADLPLGTLLENEKARAVLAKVLGPMLESPMLAQMKSMSLKKLLSMGGQTLPPEVLHALDAACAEE